jgi:hypothetical protein
MFREERAAVRSLRKFWLGLGALALGSLLAAQVQAAGQSLTPQENYVLQQVAAGQEADLKKQFGEKEDDRHLSARFLEDLLTGPYKVHRKGVMISNAMITDPLELKRSFIPHNVELVNCQFQKEVVCRDAVFEKHLVISSSHFEKAADFQRLKVKLSFFCRDAIFQGPVDFMGAKIEGQFSAERAQFQGQGEDNKANFNGLKVGEDASFEGATFKGPVNFVGADIGGEFLASGAQFQSKENQVNKANFNSLKVGQHAHFDGAIFQGPGDSARRTSKGNSSPRGPSFRGREKKTRPFLTA